MDDPMPELPAAICKIFLEWEDFGTAVAVNLSSCSLMRPRILKAVETLGALGRMGGPNTVVLMKPLISYNKVEFMLELIYTLPPKMQPPNAKEDMAVVRQWLGKWRGRDYPTRQS